MPRCSSATLLRGKGDWAAVVAHYRDYLDAPARTARSAPRRASISPRRSRRPSGDQAEAVELYRQITIDDPLSSWTTKAHGAAAPTLQGRRARYTRRRAHRARHGAVRCDAQPRVRGRVRRRARRSRRSRRPTSASPRITARRAGSRRAIARAPRRCSTTPRPRAKPPTNTDLEIKSAYQAGRSYAFIGQHETAIERYQAAQTIDPKHSYADDALLREAEEWTSLNDGTKVEEVLSALPTKFPNGDNVAEAMWRLGWRAWREQQATTTRSSGGRSRSARAARRQLLRRGPGAVLARPRVPREGQAGATRSRSGRRRSRSYPAAYYALHGAQPAARERRRSDYEALVAEISTDPAGFDPKAPAFTFKPRVEWSAPGFARAMELLRLGLGDPAASRSCKKLGLTAPGDKKRVDDPDQIEKLWAMAFLYDRAGRYATSHWPTRWHILDYRKQWPVGANRARWQIAYPKAYWELLTRHAALNNVPIAMQIGIVREESAFDPLTESYANAIGLTQMIPPTAKDFAKGTGIDPTRENLRDPEKNVTIGSRFLGSLFKTWKGFTLLVPPVVQRGPGRA